MNLNRANAAVLSFEELSRCREVFNSHVEENIKSTFDMKVILAELGQYPAQLELDACMRIHNGKVNFNTFCKYMEFLKYKFISPEPKDIDTVRAFAALGGEYDRTGKVVTDYLRETCKHFDLRIDIDQMIREVDIDNSGAISFDEFKAMWDEGIFDDEEDMRKMVKRMSNVKGKIAFSTNDALNDAAMYSTNPTKMEESMRAFFFPKVGAEKKHAEEVSQQSSFGRRGSVARASLLAPVLPPAIAGGRGTRRPSGGKLEPLTAQSPEVQSPPKAMESTLPALKSEKRGVLKGVGDSMKKASRKR